MLGLDLPLSGLDTIQQPLGGTDLLLVTQDTPDGLKSYHGTLAQLMEWIFVGSGTVGTYLPGSGLDYVRTLEPDSGLLGNGKITDPLHLDFDYLNTLYTASSVFNDYKTATDLTLADLLAHIDDLGTYADDTYLKKTTFNDHVDAEQIAREDGDQASKDYADSLDLAQRLDIINRINVEAYSRDLAIATEAGNRTDADNALGASIAAILLKLGAVGATDVQTQINALATAFANSSNASIGFDGIGYPYGWLTIPTVSGITIIVNFQRMNGKGTWYFPKNYPNAHLVTVISYADGIAGSDNIGAKDATANNVLIYSSGGGSQPCWALSLGY